MRWLAIRFRHPLLGNGPFVMLAIRFKCPHARRFAWSVLLLQLWVAACLLATAQENSEPEDRLIAKVGKQEIRWSELVYRWRLGGVKANPLESMDPVIVVEGVNAAFRQRVAQAELDRRGEGASIQEIEQWIERRLEGIEAKSLQGEDLAKKEGLSLASWKRELRWQKSWQKYSEKRLSGDALRAHYDAHPDWFNGTEREVFHIIVPCKWDDHASRAAASEQLRMVATEIAAGDLTFEEAAKKWSQGATAAEGGRLGWMDFQSPMHVSFRRAAFEVAEGQVSSPLETPHGVHLIWIRAIKPNDIPLDRALEIVRRSLLEKYFDEVVAAYPKPPMLEWVYRLEKR
jgi:hypothetical protein